MCVYWDFTAASGAGDWSSEGCTLVSDEDNEAVCHCTHLTNFAILLVGFDTYIEPTQKVKKKKKNFGFFLFCFVLFCFCFLLVFFFNFNFLGNNQSLCQ